MNTFYDNSLYIDDLKIALAHVLNFKKLYGKRLLITGAAGLVGSFIVDMLCFWNSTQFDANNKITIYAAGRNYAKLQTRFSGCWENKYLHLIEQDFTKPLNFDFSIDYIIHAASNAYPAAFNADPVGTILSNILGTNELLSYANKHQALRFLFISSGEIYGEGDPEIEVFNEEYSGYIDILSPRSCYPASKRTAETLCMSYKKQYRMDLVIARLCHTYGPNISETDNRATVQFIKSALNKETIILKSRGSQLRSYCYIADTVSAIMSILTSGECGQAYNIASRMSRITILEFAKLTAALTDTNIEFQIPTQNEKEQQTPISRAILASDKLEQLGWQSAFSIKDGIYHTIKIMEANCKNC